MQKRITKQMMAAACAVTLAWCAPASSLAANLADTVYFNGKIYPLTETREETASVANIKTVEVVAAKDGKIVFSGSKAQAQAAGYLDGANVGTLVDLHGKTMLPGFVDGHGHFPKAGTDLYEVDLNSPPLGKMDTIGDYRAAIAAKAATTKSADDLIVAFGYDDTLIKELIAEKRHLTRWDFDDVCPNPVIIVHISEHMLVANTKMLEKSGVLGNPEKLAVDGVVKNANGEPTGLMQEGLAMALIDRTYPKNPVNIVARANQIYVASGVTMADGGTDMILNQVPAMQKALQSDQLDLRVMFHPLGYMDTTGDGKDNFGWLNRAAVGWKNMQGEDLYATMPETAYKVGDDITNLPVVVYSQQGDQIYAIPYAKAFKDATYDQIMAAGLDPQRIFLGSWKLLHDGSPQGYTAWLKSPGYFDWGTNTADDSFNKAGYFNGAKGTLNASSATIANAISLYHKWGEGTETHTNGSAAAESWVTALEKAVAAYPHVSDTRDTSIHAQMVERQHIERMTGNYNALANTGDMYTDLTGAFKDGQLSPAEVGASDIATLAELMKKQNFINSYFVNHTYFWGDRHHDIFMGPGRAKNMSPTGWSEHYAQRYTFHNDTTVTPIHPLRSVQSGVTRTTATSAIYPGGTLISGEGKDINAKTYYKARATDPAPTTAFWNYDQRINVLQALHAVTINPAYQNRVENLIGSIEVGKLADFVILDQDPVKVAAEAPQTLSAIRVGSTIVGGNVVYGILPSDDILVGKLQPAFDQATATTVQMLVINRVPHAVAAKEFADVPRDHKRIGTVNFSAKVTEGKVAVFQLETLGNGGQVKDLFLHKLFAAKLQAYTYGKPTPAALDDGSASGSWWVSEFAAPAIALDPAATLEMNKTYLVHFAIRDNDGNFDTDMTPGVIVDPVSLTTTGNLPTNGVAPVSKNEDNGGGSSGGCTVSNGTASYDLLLLLAGLGLAAFVRARRARA